MELIRGKEGYIQFPNLYHLFARIHWWEDYSVEENYSVISADMEIMTPEYDYEDTWYPGGDSKTQKGQIMIGGNVIASMSYFSPATHIAAVTNMDTWVKVKNVDGSDVSWSSGKIYHNSDGTASATISTTRIHAYGAETSITHTFGTISAQTIVLTTIPRKSEITSAAAVTLGNACSVKWTPLAAVFRYRLRFAIGAWSHTTGDIAPNTTGQYTYTGYTIPMEVAHQLPNAATGHMTVTLYTYNGNTQVGEASATFAVTVPDSTDTKPSITDLVLLPEESPFPGVFLQGGSRVRATFTGEGKYGAAVASGEMTVEGKTYSGDFVSHPLMGYGDIKVTVSVTDTRGFTETVEKHIYVCPYSKPQVQVQVCQRCDENGIANDSGTYLTIEALRSYSKVMAGADQFNFCRLRYRYARQGQPLPEAWTTLLGEDEVDTVQTGPLPLNLAKDAIYIVQIGVVDTVGNTSQTTYTVMTEAVFMHQKAGGKGLGLGMYCTGDNRLDVAWDARFHGEVMIGDRTLKDYILAVISEGG